MLIFISDDQLGTWGRMEAIAKHGIFGKSRYEASLDQWKPDKDISLYLFYQSLTVDKPCLSKFSDKINEMYKEMNDSQKMYLIMYVKKGDWDKDQTEFINYDFFKKAEIVID